MKASEKGIILATDIDSPAQLDYLYNAADRLYGQFARSCGLSSCAYWMLYELVRAGGTASLRSIAIAWSYSKQTINSALKSLESRELIELSFEPGSRKSKQASLTPAGVVFAKENIVPGIEAERRAFRTLTADERATLLELANKYTKALDAEFTSMNEGRG